MGQLNYLLHKIHNQLKLVKSHSMRALLNNFKPSAPTSVRIETVDACNLRCSHCPTGLRMKHNPKNSVVMSDGTFEKTIFLLQKLPSVTSALFYVGGEPLLNKHLDNMIRRVKEETYVKRISFNTNGMLLNREWAMRLIEAKTDNITISLDGRSKEENDRIRKGSQYERIKNNIYQLQEVIDQRNAKTKIKIANTNIQKVNEINETPSIPSFLVEDFINRGIAVESGFALKWPGLSDDYLKESQITQIKSKVF